MNRLAAVALLASALLSAPALADDAITLARKAKAGTAWTFDESLEQRTKTETAEKGKPPETLETLVKSVRRGTVTILKVSDAGVPTSVKVEFDAACSDSSSENGAAPEAEPFALAGKTVTVTRGADGKVEHDYKGEEGEDLEDELEGFLYDDLVFLPEAPVKPGAEWKAAEKLVRRHYDAGETDKVSMTCKFVGVKEIGGRQAAELQISSQAEMADEDGKSAGTLTGPIFIDLETGATLQDDLVSTSTYSAVHKTEGDDGKPVERTMKGTSTASGRSTLRPAPASPAK
jgi:hypothetical protein